MLTPGPSQSRRDRLAVSRIRDGEAAGEFPAGGGGRNLATSESESSGPAGPTKTAAAARGPPRSDGHLDVVNESAYPVQPKTRLTGHSLPPAGGPGPSCLTISRIFLSLKKEAMGKQISWVVSRFNVSHFIFSLYSLISI